VVPAGSGAANRLDVPRNGLRPPGSAGSQHRRHTPVTTSAFADQMASEAISAEARRCVDPATHSPRDTADGPGNCSLGRSKPVTQSRVTGFDLWKLVAGPGFEPG
jgi:hypothetical protein